MTFRFLVTLIFSLIISLPTLANTTTQQSLSPAVKQFIRMMANKYQFNQQRLTSIMQRAEYLPKVIGKMNRPFEAKPWNFYRKFFVTPLRINDGVAYWQQHANVLAQAQAKYGVPPSLIVAIIGVETLYGKHKGTYPELSTLYTLAFHYPKRARFFKKELVNYLLLTRDQQLPVFEMHGSYAGALGIPQFMPSSYRHYGVDYARNKHIDLLHNHDDAIFSVANYLRLNGWQANKIVAMPALVSQPVPAALIAPKARRQTSYEALEQHGISTTLQLNPSKKVSLIALNNQHSQEYWVAFPNFKAIMSYNPNINYAMAVFQLSQAIKQAYEQRPA